MHKYSRRSKMKKDKMKEKEHLKLQQDLWQLSQPKPVVVKKAVEQVTKTFGDVSINDCANLSESRNRLKKSRRSVEAMKKEETNWSSMDQDEYDYFEKVNEDGTVTMVRQVIPKSDTETDTGKDYPTDIWILISGYLRPEDVGRFAAICKTSYHVTSSAGFWYSLYRRHFRFNNTLPPPLTPKNIFRKYGIRTSVIRALFHLYPPFVKRLSLFNPHPDVLQGAQCVHAWQKTGSGNWFYYFKFEEARSGRKHVRDVFEELEDVKANSEEGCRLLRIVSRNFYPLPPIERLFLASVDVRLSSSLKEQNVILTFVSDLRYRKRNRNIDGGRGACVRLDQVTKINVFDWWDSRYPHTNSLKLTLN